MYRIAGFTRWGWLDYRYSCANEPVVRLRVSRAKTSASRFGSICDSGARSRESVSVWQICVANSHSTCYSEIVIAKHSAMINKHSPANTPLTACKQTQANSIST
ncbi:hypothetical protein FVEG_17069 [Fusarium verticillioides 7600]|uniref:Uncharacterized protein n=1 Tax=Gibberella moniliformis (strain M3125 / FGSC 7600) TaxID=334819 RepID=W7MQ32_GIBM7|nr:hypothetical protein FVEG_17069 [Fusarium verticillioides 7600]EWG53191.1 hypothetical protein FVEG_17069 [Fusarium verticillioides 7600]